MVRSTKEVIEGKVVKQQKTLQEPQETEVLEQTRIEEEKIQYQENQPKETKTQEATQEKSEDTSNTTKNIDWSPLKATKSKAVEKVSGEEGVCTIVHCKKNGNKRITLASKLLDVIGNPKKIEIGIMPSGIAISEKLPVEANTFPVKVLGAKKVIYAGALVEEITEEFNLDYSNRTSITFQKVEYDNVNGYKVALVTIKQTMC